MENRFPTAIQPDVRLIRHGVCHNLGIILVPNRVPKRVSANRVGAKRLFQIMRCWITSRHSPGRSSGASSKSKKSTVPEHTSGPLGAILLHQKCKLRAPTKIQRGRKRAFPEWVTIFVGSVAEPTIDVLVFCLAEKKPFHTPRVKVALSNISSRSLR